MSKLYFVILIFTFNLTYSQTEEETIDWIIEQTIKYPVTNGGNSNWNFENGKMVVYFKFNDMELTKITELSSIKIIDPYSKDNEVGLIFELHKGKPIKFIYPNQNESKDWFEQKESFKLSTDDKEMLPRITKAFQHLIKLNGGKAEVKNQKAAKTKKEPF
ncbi:hypothetical protein [Ulvibacter litoralis]|uniref:Uncharacterized protein n=1 Tax=Ulvibacter litoralis TaxID=227084 RepID=A0A1G7JNI6_9FLAO|nr:hypothetical protein [Ulvibacter litoralis]GHC65465.1 hypothetical protein GCM10008083_33340 [Ulvibacter litoralis]SDF26029.1 hypothetical protein SAMN05421855_1195 [Ulvibacter litoralis]